MIKIIQNNKELIITLDDSPVCVINVKRKRDTRLQDSLITNEGKVRLLGEYERIQKLEFTWDYNHYQIPVFQCNLIENDVYVGSFVSVLNPANIYITKQFIPSSKTDKDKITATWKNTNEIHEKP